MNDAYHAKKMNEYAAYKVMELVKENEMLKANLDFVAIMADIEIPEVSENESEN